MDAILYRWDAKLGGGDGRLPAILVDVFFVLRDTGMPIISPSLTAALTAATLLAEFEDTLFRRVTR